MSLFKSTILIISIYVTIYTFPYLAGIDIT
jgi:hypothetical protein